MKKENHDVVCLLAAIYCVFRGVDITNVYLSENIV